MSAHGLKERRAARNDAYVGTTTLSKIAPEKQRPKKRQDDAL